MVNRKVLEATLTPVITGPTLDDAERALTHTDAILELIERYLDGRGATIMEALDLARGRLNTVRRYIDALECETFHQEKNTEKENVAIPVAGKTTRRSRKAVRRG